MNSWHTFGFGATTRLLGLPVKSCCLQFNLKMGNRFVFLSQDHHRQPHYAGSLLLSKIFLLFFGRNYLHYEHSMGLK